MNIENNFMPVMRQEWVTEGFSPPQGENKPASTKPPIKIAKERQITLECSCGHAIIKLHTDEYSTNFALYSHSSNSFWRRAIKAWKLLTKGEQALLEDTELSTEELKRLGDYALTNSKSAKTDSGYKGIRLRETGKYEAYVQYRSIKDKVVKNAIGFFDTVEEAVAAREKFLKRLL